MKPSGITFTEPKAFIRMPKWDFKKNGELTFKFRTHEPNGLMVYNGGQPGRRDFVALEMYDGIPYFIIDLGDGVHRYPFSMVPLNDGEMHELSVWRYDRNVRLSTDNSTTEYNIPSRESDLDLGTFLFVGGLDNPRNMPWHMWNRKPAHYVGCLWDLKINSRSADLGDYVKDQV